MPTQAMPDDACRLIEQETGRTVNRAKSRMSENVAQVCFWDGGLISVFPANPALAGKSIEELEAEVARLEKKAAQRKSRWRIRTSKRVRTASRIAGGVQTGIDLAVPGASTAVTAAKAIKYGLGVGATAVDPRETAGDVVLDIAVAGACIATGMLPCLVAGVAAAIIKHQKNE